MVAPIRPLPLLLGSLLLAAGCFPPIDPPECECSPGYVCVDDGCLPLACQALDETDCLARTDCQANYLEQADRCVPAEDDLDQVRCGGVSRVFESCSAREQPTCPDMVCDLWCPHGLARDAQGCEVCACAPALCTSDAECLPGEACLFPAYDCAPNALCAPPQGVCTPVEDPGCDADADCAAGERCVFPEIDCPPNAFCAPPRGTCKPADGCQTDADCGVGRRCEFFETCMAIGCEAPATGGVCVERTPCTDGSECGPGETCAMDPNDPCATEMCYFFAPAQTYCIPGCEALGEAECQARRDCEPMYEGPRCGNDPTPPTFVGCKPAACPPVMCDLWCPNGYALDANGCNTCACDDSCQSDADCQPGQVCIFLMYDCAPGEDCPAARGTCNTIDPGCLSDADCGPGQRCDLPVYDVEADFCPDGEACPPLRGTCVDVEICTAADECGPGRRCNFTYDLCPNYDVLCGRCEAAGCLSDADCAAGEACVITPSYCGEGTDEGGGTGGCIGPAEGVCVKVEQGCQSDADCGPGQVCSMPELVCPPDVECPVPTVGACIDVQPIGCTDDSQCLAGQRCDYDPMLNCGPGTNCIGQCVTAECRSDADCRDGESCIFLMDACPPGDPACPNTGICNKVEKTCGGDADCAVNEQCELVDCGPNMDCLQQGMCTPRPECSSDAECGWGESCQPDPTDICNQPNVDCFAPGRNICLPAA